MHNHQQSDSPELTTRFTHAVEYVRQVHTGFRKGTQVPYMAHLLGVASLVLGETGHVAPITVTEDMVIAALLHNAVEDEGGQPRLQDIETQFGKEDRRDLGPLPSCAPSFLGVAWREPPGSSCLVFLPCTLCLWPPQRSCRPASQPPSLEGPL